MDEKIKVQLAYKPNDELSQRAIIMLESAMRSKSQLVALALSEFAEKYGFRIDDTEEIKAVIKNYDFLSRAMLDAGSSARKTTVEEIYPALSYQQKPTKKSKPQKKETATTLSVTVTPNENTVSTPKQEVVETAEETASASETFSLDEDIVVSDRAMKSMNNVIAMFQQG